MVGVAWLEPIGKPYCLSYKYHSLVFSNLEEPEERAQSMTPPTTLQGGTCSTMQWDLWGSLSSARLPTDLSLHGHVLLRTPTRATLHVLLQHCN